MSAAFLFPGQGSEAPGMGGDALRREGPVRALLRRASERLDRDLEEIVVRGAPELIKTEVSQPAIVAVGLGLALELRASGVEAEAVAGHSVGELTACAFAGCLEPEAAIDCVIDRARLMSEAARRTPGGMAAVRLQSERDVEAALVLGRTAGAVEVAAHNGPDEWVLTGSRDALGQVAMRFPTVPLKVSGPWHSRAMAEAAAQWGKTLENVPFARPRIPLVANGTGRFVTEADDLRALLISQLTQPVRWAETMTTLAQSGADTFHVFAPSRVLRGLCRSNLGLHVRVETHEGTARRTAA